jgi:hypothetical protein
MTTPTITKAELILGALVLPPIYGLVFAIGAALFGFGAPARFILSMLSMLIN